MDLKKHSITGGRRKMKKAKRRNPQDSTLRNIRALKKRVTQLEKDVIILIEFSGKMINLFYPEKKKK